MRTKGALDYEGKASYAVMVTTTYADGLSASIAVTITVDDVAETPPGQPDAPTFVSIQQTSFRVTWAAPAPGSSAISDYGIQYKLDTEEDSAYADVKPRPSGTATGYNLLDDRGQSVVKGTSYEVRVRAQNAEGWGEWSEAATVTTARPAPPPAAADDADNVDEAETGGSGEEESATDS